MECISKLKQKIHNTINKGWICGKRLDRKRKVGMTTMMDSSSLSDIFGLVAGSSGCFWVGVA